MAIKEKNVIHRDIKLANLLVNFPQLTMEQVAKPDFNLTSFIKDLEVIDSNER